MNDEIETLPPLYAAVLETSARLLKQHPNGTSIDVLGVAAWNSLTTEERSEALPHVLAAYVSRVHDEESAKVLQESAVDPATTYLRDHDETILWDSAVGRQNEYGEVHADRQALLNVLCELELIRHRLEMRDSDTGEGGA